MPEGALTLAIETSNPGAARDGAGSVALGVVAPTGDIEILGESTLRPTGRHDDALLPAIDALVGSHGFQSRDLQGVAVSLGPGGYTSVRIATMTAKTLGFALGIACIGVPTAAVAAESAVGSAARVLVMLASKREMCWAAAVRSDDLRAIDEWGIVGATDLAARFESERIDAVLADSHLPESVRKVCADRRVRIDDINLNAIACLRASRCFDEVDPMTLAPIYPREPEAVRVWRERRANRA